MTCMLGLFFSLKFGFSFLLGDVRSELGVWEREVKPGSGGKLGNK